MKLHFRRGAIVWIPSLYKAVVLLQRWRLHRDTWRENTRRSKPW